MKKRYISETAHIAAAMALSLFVTGIFSAAQTEKNLEKSLVRLHILADSDSEEDQRLKLLVRDAILASSEELFEPYSTSDEAIDSLSGQLDRIKEIADNTLAANGSDDTVTCELREMSFDRRIYNDFAVPAGNYTALRVTIGSGEGHNWWCVMYPPLCVPCAGVSLTDEEIMEKYGGELTEEDILMLSEESDYEARLYIAELIEKLFDNANSAE